MALPDRTTKMIPFDNSYVRLPDRFYARLDPTPVPAPRLIRLNRPLAAELGLDVEALATPAGAEILAGNRKPDGAEPLAMAYAGHQFGGWSPQLGDGRAILLGEVIDRNGRRRDIQLKGSGQTPFSRMGDGRAPLGPVLREYIVSEAMTALGVPTTRALAAVATGDPVVREAVLPGAVLTRVAASHIRVGTFQFFAARRDQEALRLLADHVIERHDPAAADLENRYWAMFQGVVERQIRLIAQWMGLGFIHGVMNTDNMTISGETIDYGPCAFMDGYHPETVFSSIDQFGRYAYASQPNIARWNLACLAQAMLPLLGEDQEAAIAMAQAAIDAFPDQFRKAWLVVMRQKIGLFAAQEDDGTLIDDLLDRMAANEADFTLTFRHLADAGTGETDGPQARDLFKDPAILDGWLTKWRARLALENVEPVERRTAMQAVNPLYIPRNHLVEEAIAAAYQDDFSPFEELLEVLSTPFDEQPDRKRYTLPPRPEQVVQQTFCGT